MSDYKRLVSYIYEYVEGEKRESNGFVKVNARDGVCKIRIHMRGFYIKNQEPYRVYVFVQKRERLSGLLLGELESRNGALEWSGITESENLMNGGFGLGDSQGIYIEGEGRVYAARWDDFPVDVENFTPIRRSVRQTVDESVERIASEERTEAVRAAEIDVETVAQENQRAQEIPEADEKKSVELKAGLDSRGEQWKYLENRFPVMRYVDGGGAVISSIRLDPKSLTRVPRDKWELGNNSFLLHGLYQYRHLLLLRRQMGDEISYYIGIPGVYNDQEQVMASMFGFQEFRMLKEPGAKQGSFGYWCRTLK